MKKWLIRIGLGVVGLALVAVAVYGYMRKANDKDIPAAVKTTVLKDGEIRAAIKGDKGDVGKTGDTGKAGDKGEPGAKGDPGEKGDKGDPGEAGTCDASTCKGAVAKIPPVSTVTGAPAPKPVKKTPSVVKSAPVLAPAPVEPEPPRIQVYQPLTVTINGEPVAKGEKADRSAKAPQTSDGMTITNHGTMVVAPVTVVVE